MKRRDGGAQGGGEANPRAWRQGQRPIQACGTKLHTPLADGHCKYSPGEVRGLLRAGNACVSCRGALRARWRGFGGRRLRLACSFPGRPPQHPHPLFLQPLLCLTLPLAFLPNPVARDRPLSSLFPQPQPPPPKPRCPLRLPRRAPGRAVWGSPGHPPSPPRRRPRAAAGGGGDGGASRCLFALLFKAPATSDLGVCRYFAPPGLSNPGCTPP